MRRQLPIAAAAVLVSLAFAITVRFSSSADFHLQPQAPDEACIECGDRVDVREECGTTYCSDCWPRKSR